MPRKIRTHLRDGSWTPDDIALAALADDTNAGLTPKHLTKQAFGRRLANLMYAKHWHQSELGRRADITRDLISSYIRGLRFPTPVNLAKLAKALNVSEAQLLPNQTESAIDADHPAFEAKTSDAAPGTAWLRVNQLVSEKTALEVWKLLQAGNGSDNGE